MVELYDQVKGRFSVDEHRHYLLTPRDLTAWVRGLLRYELGREDVLDCVAYEVRGDVYLHVIGLRLRRGTPPSNCHLQRQ